jgi:hypothetical protein
MSGVVRSQSLQSGTSPNKHSVKEATPTRTDRIQFSVNENFANLKGEQP